jgi:3-hydroxyisobutyrate dehydrogenase-like beta-hydroxyacid dehydrogenase
MALRLLDCGLPLTVWNRTASKADAAVERGATLASSPAHLAERCEVIITCLLGSAADDEVYRGPNGLLASTHGQLFINTATVGPDAARKLAADVEAIGCQYVDAPLMGGGVKAALAGTLLLPVGCKSSAFDRALPVLQLLADRIENLGSVGAAQVMKLINNLQIAIHHNALSEALRVGFAAGADREAMLRILPQGSSHCRAMDLDLVPMLTGIRTSRGTLKTSAKDLDLALELARSVGEPSEVGAAASRRMHRLVKPGNEHLDIPALVDLEPALTD